MTQQVLYATANGAILQWQDTAAFGYPANPAGTAVLAVTPSEWAAQTSAWYVLAGVLTAGAAPAPALTLAQQAQAAMAAGLTVTLSGTLTLAATVFPTDPTTQTKIDGVMTTVNTTGAFAGGATTFPMRDAANVWHPFTVAQYKAVALAIDEFATTLDLIIDGNPSVTALPATSIALTV